MTTSTQQIPSNPALDFANSILEVTNNGLELIEILRDIANDCDEKATTNDRIAAANILTDRAFGKCPKQVSPSPDPAPETGDNDGGTLPETPSTVSQNGPESPRLVTQIDDALHDSLGPAPNAPQPTRHSGEEPAPYPIRGRNPEGWSGASHHTTQTPDPSDPYSIHFTIQQHILAITNNGQMLRDILLEIARTEDDPKDCPEPRRRVTPYHRRRAASLLLDRLMGTDPNALRSGVCPDCRRKWTAHPGSHDHPEPSRVVGETEEEPFDREVWEEIIAELNQLEEAGIITPDPDAPEVDMSAYMKWTDEQIAPYAAEVAAKFDAEIALRVERQKQWPEIEERRRKKLKQIYPSHSDDGKSPDT